MASPPFNDSDWRGEQLKEDKRWVYGVPSAGNAAVGPDRSSALGIGSRNTDDAEETTTLKVSLYRHPQLRTGFRPTAQPFAPAPKEVCGQTDNRNFWAVWPV